MVERGHEWLPLVPADEGQPNEVECPKCSMMVARDGMSMFLHLRDRCPKAPGQAARDAAEASRKAAPEAGKALRRARAREVQQLHVLY